jgi:hypothetical protein
VAKGRTVKDLRDELMIYEPEADLIHFLNPTARRIYQLHEQGMDPAVTETILRREFAIPEHRDVQSDVRRCLDELGKKKLLESVGGQW